MNLTLQFVFCISLRASGVHSCLVLRLRRNAESVISKRILTDSVIIALMLRSESFLVDSNPYRHIETLDDEGKYILEWMVDWDNKRVIFNVSVATTGYIGFGLSRRGKMTGADIVIGGVSPEGKPYLTDRHALGHNLPVMDAQQDWTLHSAVQSEGYTFLSFSRAFDTCDKEDYPITEDVMSIIWAYGENDDVVEYHFQNRGNRDIYLLDPDLTPRIAQPLYRTKNPKELGDLKVWSINKIEVIPPVETYYTCSFHKAPRSPKKGHIVGFNTVLQSELERRHINHFFLYRCHPPHGRDAAAFFERYVRNRGEQCYTLNTASSKIPTMNCREPIHIWSVGGKPVFLPGHVGIPLAETTNEYFMLQAHYVNPERLPGMRLRYSLEIFYTPNPRKHDAGVMLTGHTVPGSPSLLIPPSSLGHVIHGICGSDCTKQMFPETGIQVFAASMHTHGTGRGTRLLQIRDNHELPWISFDDNYHYKFQQTRILRKERTVLPGDQIITRCAYETTGKKHATVGGMSLRNEICVGVMWYYNRIPGYGICNSEIKSKSYFGRLGVSNATWSNAHLEMVMSAPPSPVGITMSEIFSHHFKWNIGRRAQLLDDHRFLPHVTQCPTLIPGMHVTRQQGRTVSAPSSTPTLQRYVLGGKQNEASDKDLEYNSVYSKDVVSYERPEVCVKEQKHVVEVNNHEYQSPVVQQQFPSGTWWSVDTKSEGYNPLQDEEI
ncbi:unnamed protein product [Orchesella dallaii]|uniref:DOMON domain-containing protein n=1 Tax=Orchesella dallaii TaxID=48710 RepID=A0ABP1S341_9HEXA